MPPNMVIFAQLSTSSCPPKRSLRTAVRRSACTVRNIDTVSHAMRRKTTYTLTEAAEVTGKGRATIRRYLDAGRFPNAFQEDTADPFPAWRIPSSDLIAAGLAIDLTRPATRPSPVRRAASTVMSTSEQLSAANAVAAERARTIEALTLELAETRRALMEALTTMRALADSREDS